MGNEMRGGIEGLSKEKAEANPFEYMKELFPGDRKSSLDNMPKVVRQSIARFCLFGTTLSRIAEEWLDENRWNGVPEKEMNSQQLIQYKCLPAEAVTGKESRESFAKRGGLIGIKEERKRSDPAGEG